MKYLLWVSLLAVVTLGWQTAADLKELPTELRPPTTIRKPLVVDRAGHALLATYQNDFNVFQQLPLAEIPPLLQALFVYSEDKRFFSHHGIDWWARLSATIQNIKSFKSVRGASTISEQVVRIVHPRKRTLWSRWLEGIEAWQLEKRFSKHEILEFYLNQVPYARNRRGVSQAAQDLFQRDVKTLNSEEMFALAVLPRAPTRLDPRGGQNALRKRMIALAERVQKQGLISEDMLLSITSKSLLLERPRGPGTDASHFLRALGGGLLGELHPQGVGVISTTLDMELQDATARLLDARLQALAPRNVSKAACLIVDHHTNEILAWVNAAHGALPRSAADIDGVLMARQPGSTLKPFLYALALERGYSPATLIEDAPLVRPVSLGLHQYRNYSQKFHGFVRLREALGNSLNLPAIRTAIDLGPGQFLERLRMLGFQSLDKSSDYYGEGLALGNGEVTLFELVRAYSVLARLGLFQELHATSSDLRLESRRVFSAEVSSLIADILADPEARHLEFGAASLLNFPVETAVKTGTSTDYRDAWAIAFSHRYTVGVWFGNADQTPMSEIAGAIGPGLVLRGVFAELNRRRHETQPLERTSGLHREQVCRLTGLLAGTQCPTKSELFDKRHLPLETCQGDYQHHHVSRFTKRKEPKHRTPGLVKPSPHLVLARDPRIPDSLEAFPFELEEGWQPSRVEWILNGTTIAETVGRTRFLWPLSFGKHTVEARLHYDSPDTHAEGASPLSTNPVSFEVR